MWYTKEHEWIKVENDQAIVGITEHAAHALGDITFIELPNEGDKVSQMQQFSTIESIKAASDIYAPIDGVVAEVNQELETTPELISESPEDKAWICKIGNINQEQLQGLMTKEQYQSFIGAEK